MKNLSKLIALACTAAALLFTSDVKAQTTPAKALRFSIGLEAGVPTGVETDHANWELGGTARLQYGITNNFALTLTSGLYNFFSKDMPGTDTRFPTLNIIPLKLGVKAFVSPNFYLAAEGGAAFIQRNESTKLDLSPGLGWANKSWDIGLRYENFSTPKIDYGIVALRLGYGF